MKTERKKVMINSLQFSQHFADQYRKCVTSLPTIEEIEAEFKRRRYQKVTNKLNKVLFLKIWKPCYLAKLFNSKMD